MNIGTFCPFSSGGIERIFSAIGLVWSAVTCKEQAWGWKSPKTCAGVHNDSFKWLLAWTSIFLSPSKWTKRFWCWTSSFTFFRRFYFYFFPLIFFTFFTYFFAFNIFFTCFGKSHSTSWKRMIQVVNRVKAVIFKLFWGC